MLDFYLFLYYGIPVAAVVFFLVTLILHLSARRKARRAPGSVSEQTLRLRRTLFIIASVLMGILLAVVVAFIALMLLAVAFM